MAEKLKEGTKVRITKSEHADVPKGTVGYIVKDMPKDGGYEVQAGNKTGIFSRFAEYKNVEVVW